MQHTYDKLVDTEQLKRNLSDNLIYFMHTNYISFEELSMMIDVSALAIRKWVDCISLPRLEHIYALALVTRTPIESWLTMGGIQI